MALMKNVFRRRKVSDQYEADTNDEDDSLNDEEVGGQDAGGDEGQMPETLLSSEFMTTAGELKSPETPCDRETSPADGLTRQHSSSRVSRKSRCTHRDDANEGHHVNDESEKRRSLHSPSKRSGMTSQAKPSGSIQPERSNDENVGEFGFEIEVSIPAEPAREVLRRSSSRERGRQSRSSSRDAMRQVRERSRQRRSERANKENPDSSQGRVAASSQNGSEMTSPMHSAAISQEHSNVNATAQDGNKTPEKMSRSPRPGTRSRSSERQSELRRESAGNSRDGHTDGEKSLGTSQGQASSDGVRSNHSSLNRARGSSREGRRSRREKESAGGVSANSNEKDSATTRTELTPQNFENSRGESAENANPIHKRSPHSSSSHDIIRSRRSDSKERSRRSRGDSKERPSGTRSSSKDRRGQGRSRSKEGLSLRMSRGDSEKGDESTSSVPRRDKSDNDEKSPLKSVQHEASNIKRVPRRNSREEIVNQKPQSSTIEENEMKTRIPRRNSREDKEIKTQMPRRNSREDKEIKTQMPRRNSREEIKTQTPRRNSREGDEIKSRFPRRNSREDALRQQPFEHGGRKHESTFQSETNNGRDDPHPHHQINQQSEGLTPSNKSTRQVVGRNNQDASPRKPTQLVADEMPPKSGSPSRGERQGSRERRSRRPRVQSSDENGGIVLNGEASIPDDSIVDDATKAKEMEENVEMVVPRALPGVIIHEELEKQKLEATKVVVESCTEVNPAMALLNHLWGGDIVAPANHSSLEPQPVTEEGFDSQSINILDDIEPEVKVVPDEENDNTSEESSIHENETWKAEVVKDDSASDSGGDKKQSNVADKSINYGSQESGEVDSDKAEFDAFGHTEPLSATKAERNTNKDMAKIKRKDSMGAQGDSCNKDFNPANDLLGFLGSNYDDLFAKNEESSTPTAPDPFLQEKLESSVEFFRAISFPGFHHPPADDDGFDRLESLMGTSKNDTSEVKPLPPPSVAPVDEFAKQKARLARRLSRQKKVAVDEEEGEKPSTLCPPSLAGDMPKLMRKSSARKPKKETSSSPPPTRGVSRSSSDDGSTMKSMLNALEKPSAKSTSGSRPKIRRAKSGDSLPLNDNMCEQSLAPPSLAPPSLAPRRMAPKTPEKEEEMPRKVTRREVRKATQFASLEEDEDDEESVGIIVATTSPAEMPKRRGGMLSKAQSAVNILEKTTRRVVKKATSKKNVFSP